MKNNLRIEFDPLFIEQHKEAKLNIKGDFLGTLELFLVDPNHPALRNHALNGEFAGVRSIDVTGDWRALYRAERERIIFVALGTHEQLYG